ncbi:Predicted thiol-disulfide oxidoreductase YuxK, DCC family [Halpernia humi]|uniref:Predicted thiol-disulfide oxidoreductase YuxK, DCC family n=1 Tax=Halpernia humi TaxID=493375 RepID=A0A1H5ZZ98_9FLAO|nr:DCC1-like thiol-disulfide oxidoreductase family protein [Halpernia humi]SEG41828.1 Predicted thiol-disulfide oxidoreductase YuxK, DCC family [Halpernia humi]
MKDSGKYYVLYDGECGFCNFWVAWILKNDKNDLFLFSALQSEFGQNFLTERGLENKTFDTLYLYAPQHFYLSKSSAVLKIASLLGGVFSLFSFFKIIPRFFRDKVYDLISTNRQKIASAKCYLPTAQERKKFIDN